MMENEVIQETKSTCSDTHSYQVLSLILNINIVKLISSICFLFAFKDQKEPLTPAILFNIQAMRII
jgi:hypothetical protein